MVFDVVRFWSSFYFICLFLPQTLSLFHDCSTFQFHASRCHFPIASVLMASKKKRTTNEFRNLAGFIPPYDENRPLPTPCAISLLSSIFESDLLCLVEMGVIPPKELSSLRSWEGLWAPTEDTHEAVVFASFIQGLSVYSFIRGLFDSYSIGLTHMNPNS